MSDEPEHHHAEVSKYRVALVGAQGVGKTALISQFMTSECINAYDHKKGKYMSNTKFITFNSVKLVETLIYAAKVC